MVFFTLLFVLVVVLRKNCLFYSWYNFQVDFIVFSIISNSFDWPFRVLHRFHFKASNHENNFIRLLSVEYFAFLSLSTDWVDKVTRSETYIIYDGLLTGISGISVSRLKNFAIPQFLSLRSQVLRFQIIWKSGIHTAQW